MSSSDRFGYEWNKYSEMNSKYESQFRNWLYPLTEKDFVGKSVLDAGCGMGRNSVWPLAWGAASLTAFDFDERSVAKAKKTLKNFPNAEVVFKSIYDIDWKNAYDIAFSIGVIHHLDDPLKALKNLVRALRPDGTLMVWVYSREGNEWIITYVDPIRKYLTSRLPLPLVHFISYFCSVPLFLFAKLFRGPTAYLAQLSEFNFRHIHSIVFDQLIPRTANYWSKEEVTNLFSNLGLREVTIHMPPNNMGWTIIGKK